jgi:hypothetical protein
LNVNFEAMKEEITNILSRLGSGLISKDEAIEKLLNLHSVSVPFPSDELIEERGKEFESKTYYNLEEGEKIGDFEVGAKWVVDYLKGNER